MPVFILLQLLIVLGFLIFDELLCLLVESREVGDVIVNAFEGRGFGLLGQCFLLAICFLERLFVLDLLEALLLASAELRRLYSLDGSLLRPFHAYI